jgi:hypothetical protein
MAALVAAIHVFTSAQVHHSGNTASTTGIATALSTQVAPGAVAVLVCDGAGSHERGGVITLPDTVLVLSMPPYARVLNPMENVWDYLRAKRLSARIWNSYGEIANACAAAWNWFVTDPHRVRSIGHRERAKVNV